MSGQDDLDAMEQFVDDHDLSAFDHIADPGGSIWRAFQINAQPSFVFINDDGTIQRHIGGLSVDELTAAIDTLTAG